MDNQSIVVFDSFYDPIKANIIKGLLDSYGIECFLSDENMATIYSQYSPAIGGVKLNVFEKDLDRINEIMKAENIEPELASEEKSEPGIICPECKSSNVGYGGSVHRKFGLWNAIVFSLLSIFLFISSPFYLRKTYHCFECNHEFKNL